ncbi:hypothetical protein [Fundidesulfovibrio putealis]|uniref:hypothetical protein n=1 Tax=Fundidesulfovibrio putealis TaxID=270496 RepID=UPI00040EDE88|nr:hypothetical protein [Fundidesulfovibrio putealis]
MAFERIKILAVLLGVFFLAASAPERAQAQELSFPVITGENWMNATPDERLAFIAGLTTMIEMEKEVQGISPLTEQRSLIPAWVKGLSRFKLKDIVTALDDVFKKKPELKSKPVVEVLWYEVAFPEEVALPKTIKK